jgi:hypothetical protein
MSRRVVLAPGNADCVPFPATTNNHRGQEAGIPYDRNVIVMVMAMLARPCVWNQYGGEFGPNGALNADIAGFIFMYSDENDPDQVEENWAIHGHFGRAQGGNVITYPAAAVARGAGPVGGLTMATEIFNGHRVDLLWPGTGPMTGTAERAALKDFMQMIVTDYDHFEIYAQCGYGNGGTEIMPEEFIADDSIDPCSNNGQGKHLYGVTCIGGHVVSLWFNYMTSPKISGFPASIAALTQLRHIYGKNGFAPKLVIPCEFGQLANLKTIGLMRSGPEFSKPAGWSGASLEFPEDDECMNGLVSLEDVMLGAIDMNKFPASFLRLPQMQTVQLTRAPLAALPATLSPNIRVLRLSDVGAIGPLPSFKGSALLEDVSLDHNSLTLGTADAFDNCPNLRTVDVSHNNISAAVFRFEGSTKLEIMDLSHNSMRGSIPEQWAQLESCEVLKLSHNLIEESMGPIAFMSQVESVDISHNRVRWEQPVVGGKTGEPNTVRWWATFAPPRIATFDASYNLLQEPWDAADSPAAHFVGTSVESQKYPRLTRMDLSHNFLWGFLALRYSFFNLDLSHNNITLLEIGSTTTGESCGTAAAFRRQMYSIDWRNQMSRMSLMLDNTIMPRVDGVGTIDQALNSSSIDFKTVEFMPRYDAFEQSELPAGSGRFPFSCPTWLV